VITIDFNVLITATLTALFVSAFVSIEQYFINKHLIKNLEKLGQKVKRNGKSGVE